MMNQAASATGRPAGSTATAGCCPMFNAPFFVNTFAPQTSLVPPPSVARQCFLGPQTNQLQIPSIQPPPQQHNVAPSQSVNHHHNHQHPQQQPPQPAAPSNGSDNFQQISQQPQQQQQQQHPIRSQDHTTNYNTTSSIAAPGLSIQHLRHSASNCMALAAALASASFPHFQQLQQAQQQLQATTPINSTTNSSNLPNPVPSAPINVATANTATTQVPLLNFNSYNVAQPFLNLPAPPAPPPLAAHLNLSSSNNNNHNNINTRNNSNTTHQSNGTTNFTSATNQPTVVPPVSLANTGNLSQTVVQPPQQPQHRPLGTNTTLNSAANQQLQQQQPPNYRSNAATALPTIPLAPPQPLGHVTRSILSDEALNSLFNDQFQAMLLNQLFANQQFAPSVTVPAQQPQQQVSSNTARPLQQQTQQQQQQQQHQNDASQVAMPSAQPVATPVVPQQPVQEPVSGQQQTYQPQQATAQSRLAQVPNVDSYTSSGINNSNNFHQQQQPHHTSSVNHNQTNSDSVPRIQQQPQPSQQQHQQQQQQQVPQPQAPQQHPQQQPQQQQQSQQQHTIPPLFYSSPQMEQALALLANPQVANNIFSHIFNAMYLQNNIRSETHQTQHHHPAHHFHHHLHGAHHHHHHHHGTNGQPNGQDVTMPLDSLAISESKPRGLSKNDLDSLQTYVHANEKDSHLCVICLSKFELKVRIRPLPCNHAFHAKCVDKWLRANRTCPICRRDALMKPHQAKVKQFS